MQTARLEREKEGGLFSCLSAKWRWSLQAFHQGEHEVVDILKGCRLRMGLFRTETTAGGGGGGGGEVIFWWPRDHYGFWAHNL